MTEGIQGSTQGSNLGILRGLGEQELLSLDSSLLTIPILLVSGLAFILNLLKDTLILPTEFMGETTDGGVGTAGLKAQDTKGSGDDHAALL